SMDQATENLRVVKEQFSKGVVTNTDVLDAETLLMQAQVNYFSAVADGNVAAARLQESIGK
ncbi:MAG TPA: TolC family protein, partial [Candidatus Kapabacteria bacterium]|nr:TolC family protein [Candidatus Kapabacteria bacterium]